MSVISVAERLKRPYDERVLRLDVDPIAATFRAAKETPLHRWYPFLEAYSTDFVHAILREFAPNAKRVLDPFGGVGTTPIAFAQVGGTAFYSEVNPFLQLLSETKILALRLPRKERDEVVKAMTRVGRGLDDAVMQCDADSGLTDAYFATFGSSAFFEKETLDQVLRARTFVDELSTAEPTSAKFVNLAFLSSLIPASQLRRAGDLRFRRGSEIEQVQDFLTHAQAQILQIAEDIDSLEQIESEPLLVAGDAKTLSSLPSLGVDAVVSSPPYLNGTNYFRNTKVELWFIRAVRKGKDLSQLRNISVTAGINDVSGEKSLENGGAAGEVVAALSGAYDRRIPKMVGLYFQDMQHVLKGICHHLVKGGVAAVDIGDSVYDGIHIPTDHLLAQVADPLGLKLVESVSLRARTSRDQTPLVQVLLVFEFKGRRAQKSSVYKESRPWTEFKKDLPHQASPYAKRNWGHPLHSLCSYQGKMKPSLAHFLVKSFVPQGGRLLDPFAGVGTIPFEAALQGSVGMGFEISPAAFVIADAKLRCHDREAVDNVIDELDKYIQVAEVPLHALAKADEVSFNSRLSEYFHPDTFHEILAARKFFNSQQQGSGAHRLVESCLLHILHGNRPYALSRRSHPITPFAPTGPSEYRALIPRLKAKVSRSLDAELPTEFVSGEMFDADATLAWPTEVSRLDAIVTSPPFFDSTRFYLANWMRLWFTGWERKDFDWRPRAFVDERQKRGFAVYQPIFRQARERLKKGGVVVLHLGRSKKCDMSAELAKVAEPWFRVADRFSESVAHCESHGIRDKGTVTDHQFLVLQ